MKYLAMLNPLLLFFFLATATNSHTPQVLDSPNFSPPGYLACNRGPILGNNLYSCVSVCDWNGDGKKDLLVGVFFNGSIYLYLNEGEDEEPQFGAGILVEADGLPLSVGYG